MAAPGMGSYLQGLMTSGVISPDRVMPGSDVGGTGNTWYMGNDGNVYLPQYNSRQIGNGTDMSFTTDYSNPSNVVRIPMSNLSADGKDRPGSWSDFLDPNSGGVIGKGNANFASTDPMENLTKAFLAFVSGGAASAGLGAAGAAGAGGGATGGAGGFVGEGAASGIPAWDGALAAAPSGAMPAAGAAAAFNPAADSQLASEQLGITGSQAAGDAANAAIPSVTVNGTPSSLWGSLFPNTGTDTLSSPWSDIGQKLLTKAGTSLLSRGASGLMGGGGGGSGLSLSLPQTNQPSTFVGQAPGYYSIASAPKNPYMLGLMGGNSGN